MRVLVTGGAGFIGSHIVQHFDGKADIRVLDSLRTGYLENIQGIDLEFIEGSITDRALVKRAVQGVDFIFHLAAMISVPESMEKPLECVEINTQGTLKVLQEAAEAGVKKLCFSSSAANYGDNPTVPKLETMIPEPKSPYAVTKLDGEYYCGIFHEEGWLNTACSRYFNVFGPRQDPGSQYAAAVPIFIHRALRNQPITIYGDGSQTRDFVYVKDVVAANVHLAQNGAVTGVYNVAYGQRQTIQEVAEKIIELTGSASAIERGPVRAGDVKHSQAAVEKLLATGFSPDSRFDEGLARTIEFFKGRMT
jgi:UDP-glucose 4-epimerase